MTTETRIWSARQQAIFNFVSSGRGHGVVRARAGTGKTTTILEALNHVASDKRVLLCAFNKKIAEELSARIASSKSPGEAKTLHSLGYSIIRARWGNTRPDTDRGHRLAQAVLSGSKVTSDLSGIVAKAVSLAKGTIPFATLQEIEDLIISSVDFDEVIEAGYTISDLSKWTAETMAMAMEQDGTIDFDDMVWLPVAHKWTQGMFDMVIVDEAQDMNATQLLLAQAALAKGGRLLIVGDDRQAIYGFRGADSGSIDRLKSELSATEMTLNITYRCPRKVVEYAARLVPDYQAAPEAPDGKISSVGETAALKKLKAGDVVLSRVNAPLARLCLTVLRSGRKARIEGRDVGAGIASLVKKLSKHGRRTVAEMLEALRGWTDVTVTNFKKMNRPSAESRIGFVLDQADMIREFAEGVKSTGEILNRIASLFANDGKPAVVFSSIHKAKGMEWNNVYILRKTLYPGKSKQEGNQEEENLEYVAVTRTKKTLMWVTGDSE